MFNFILFSAQMLTFIYHRVLVHIIPVHHWKLHVVCNLLSITKAVESFIEVCSRKYSNSVEPKCYIYQVFKPIDRFHIMFDTPTISGTFAILCCDGTICLQFHYNWFGSDDWILGWGLIWQGWLVSELKFDLTGMTGFWVEVWFCRDEWILGWSLIW